MKYKWLDEYLLGKPGTEKDFKLEWGWRRYMVRGKLFAAVCSPRGMKDERYNDHDLVNLKCDPRLAEAFREQYPEILPGFYCDKRLWVAALLDGDLPDDVLKDLCDMSYKLIVSKLPKYVQKELKDSGCPKKETGKVPVSPRGPQRLPHHRWSPPTGGTGFDA